MGETGSVRAQAVRVRIFEESTAAAVESEVNNWLASSSERRLLSVQWHHSDTVFTVLISYTD